MLIKYHFKIKHVKGLDNAKADALSRKKELQENDKVSGALLKSDKNGKIRYNHPQLLETHKVLKNSWEQQIKEAQETDPNYKDYKGKEMQLKITYILSEITEKFITEFHKRTTQRHNGAIVLVARLR